MSLPGLCANAATQNWAGIGSVFGMALKDFQKEAVRRLHVSRGDTVFTAAAGAEKFIVF